MKNKRKKLKMSVSILLCICLTLSSLGGLPKGTTVEAAGKVKVIGYFPQYRMSTLDSIDFSALTHVVLSFMRYKGGNLTLDFSDDEVRRVVAKARANNVKVMIALGGGDGFDTASQPISTPEKRKQMVDGLMAVVDQYNLDGVDIDTEVTDGGFWNDFDAFIAELSGRLKAENKLLTIAVSSWFTGSISNSTYNYFDFVNLMTYDENAGHGPVASMEFVYNQVNHYKGKGISDDRLMIGVPFYGYGPGGWSDAHTYAEILAMNEWAAKNQDEYNEIYYNSEKTIREKAEYSKNYGGIMIWELGQDAFGDNSLLKVIKNTLGDAIGDDSGNTAGTGEDGGNSEDTGYVERNDATVHELPKSFESTDYSAKNTARDMETGGIKYLGYMEAGSYVEYKIHVPRAGKYQFTINLGTPEAGRTITIAADGTILNTINVATTQGWEIFGEQTCELSFDTAGDKTLRLTVNNSVNLSNITITEIQTQQPEQNPEPEPEVPQPEKVENAPVHVLPGSFESTAYSEKYIARDIDVNGVKYLGYLENGSYVDYKIQVPKAGKYQFAINLGTPQGGRIVTLAVDGMTLNTINVETTQDWEVFHEQTCELNFETAGEKILRLSVNNSVNLSNITITEIQTDQPEVNPNPEPEQNPDKKPETDSPIPQPEKIENAPVHVIPGEFESTAYSEKYAAQDMEVNGTRYLGNLAKDSYVEYKIQVLNAGKYQFAIDLGTTENGSTVEVTVDGANLAIINAVPTENGEKFKKHTCELNFDTPGNKTLRLSVNQSVNLSRMAFDEIKETPSGNEQTLESDYEEQPENSNGQPVGSGSEQQSGNGNGQVTGNGNEQEPGNGNEQMSGDNNKQQSGNDNEQVSESGNKQQSGNGNEQMSGNSNEQQSANGSEQVSENGNKQQSGNGNEQMSGSINEQQSENGNGKMSEGDNETPGIGQSGVGNDQIPENSDDKNTGNRDQTVATSIIGEPTIPVSGEIKNIEQMNTSEEFVGVIFRKGALFYKITNLDGKNNTVALIKCNQKSIKSLTVPGQIEYRGNDYKVTAIGDKAFQNYKKLNTVIIGNNVTSIGKSAFYKCKKLKKVTIKSKTLKKVGKNAFKGIYSKARIKVGSTEMVKKYQKLLEVKVPAKAKIVK